MMRLLLHALVLLPILLLFGCGSREHLSPTTGRAYQTIFAAQAENAGEGQTPPAPLGSKEVAGIQAKYLGSFMDQKSGSGSDTLLSGGGPNPLFNLMNLGGEAGGEKTLSLTPKD